MRPDGSTLPGISFPGITLSDVLSLLLSGTGVSPALVALATLLVLLTACLVIRQVALSRRRALRIETILAGDEPAEHLQKTLRRLLLPSRYLATRKERDQIAVRLHRAGIQAALAPDAYILARMLLPLGAWAGCVYLFVEPQSPADLADPVNLLKQMAAAILTVRVMEWWLDDRVRSRLLKIRQQAPQAMELLTICVASGLTFETSLERVARELDASVPELAEEFRRLSSDLTISKQPVPVLERFAGRSGVRELETMARTMIQSIRFGTPVTESLNSVAEQSRLMQIDAIKERAGAVPAKMSLPLIILVLFPALVLLAGPALVNLIRLLTETAV